MTDITATAVDSVTRVQTVEIQLPGERGPASVYVASSPTGDASLAVITLRPLKDSGSVLGLYLSTTGHPEPTDSLVGVLMPAVTLGDVTVSPSSATVGVAYSGVVAGFAFGATLSLSGSGAAGLSINSATGAITGTPTTAGPVNVIQTLYNGTNSPKTTSGSITVGASSVTLTDVTVSPSSATVGTAYSGMVSGFALGAALSLSGAGAAGLSVNSTTGAITGTPTATGAVNVTQTLAGATNSPKTTSNLITVGSAAVTLSDVTVSPSTATVGTAYSGAVSGFASGATLSLTGAGAAGLSVNSTTGAITGTPTATGAVNVTQTLAGATNSPKTTSNLITVGSAAVTLSDVTVSPSTATVGTAYSGAVSGFASGATLSLTGAGAAGLSVNSTTGAITGTPTATGTVNVTQTLAGATNSPKTTSNLITVGSAAVTLSDVTVSPSTATVGTAYSGTVSGFASGATLSLSGAGAAGLSVNSTTGAITGTPTATGAVNVTQTLAGATNSPKTTSGLITVSAALGAFPAFAKSFYRVDPESPANTSYTVDQTFAPGDVNVGAGTIYLPSLPQPFAAWTGMSSAKAAKVWFETTGTLPGGLSTALQYYLAPTGTAGYYWIYPVATDDNWPSLYANVPNAILKERVLPAQYYGQGVNRLSLSSQGSGTHKVKTWKRVTCFADADGGAFVSGDPAAADLHKSFEVRTDGRKSWIEHELLLRNPDMAASYNIHGFGAEQGPSGQRIAAQSATASKRVIAGCWALRWGETDTYGIAKVPYVPSNVSTATGRLTFTSHGLSTGWRARLQPRSDGGVLPAGWSASTDYYIYRVDANTISLHSQADAATGANPIVPTDAGSVGFIVYCPDQWGDGERTRFIMELRRPDNGTNRLTIRSNYVSYTQIWQGTAFTVTGSNNGNVGGSGISMTPAVPTNTAYCKVRIRFANASGAPVRQDTGLAMPDGEYWMTRVPNSTSSVRFHLTEADAVASLGVATVSATCIRYTAQGTSAVQVETVKRYVTANVERGSEPTKSTLGWDTGLTTFTAPWDIPVGTDGVLTAICDYNDDASSYVRTRFYWNKTLVQDWQPTDGAKGLTSSATSSSMAAWTLLNSPDGHVSFEGRVYGGFVASDTNAITIDDLGPQIDWYLAKMAA